MHNRKAVTAKTLRRFAAEVAGIPVSPSTAAAQAPVFEALMESIETLRSLPIKDISPALVFVPEMGHEQ